MKAFRIRYRMKGYNGAPNVTYGVFASAEDAEAYFEATWSRFNDLIDITDITGWKKGKGMLSAISVCK